MGFLKNFTANHKAKQARLKVDKDTARALNMLEGLRVELNNRVIDQKRMNLEKAKYEPVAEYKEDESNEGATDSLEDLFDFGDLVEEESKAENPEDEATKYLNLVDSGEGGISPEKMDEYLLSVSALEQHMKDHSVVRLDIRKIDSMLQKIVNYMMKAVRRDDVKTTEEAMNALKWGIIKGRADMENADRHREKELIEHRVSIFDQYLTAITAAQELGEINKSLRKQLNEKEKLMESVRKLQKQTQTISKEDMEAFRLHKDANIPFTIVDEQIQNLMTEVYSCKKELEKIVTAIIQYQKQSVARRETISKVHVALLTSEVELNENVAQQMKRITEKLKRSLAEQNEVLNQLTQANEEFDQVFSAWETPMAVRLKEERAYMHWIEGEKQEIARKEEKAKIREKLEKEKQAQKSAHRQVITNG